MDENNLPKETFSVKQDQSFHMIYHYLLRIIYWLFLYIAECFLLLHGYVPATSNIVFTYSQIQKFPYALPLLNIGKFSITVIHNCIFFI